MKKNINITVPKLSSAGGVSAFWNALLPEFSAYKDLQIKTLEIGGHGKNIFGPVKDQLNFRKVNTNAIDLVVLNPSLGARSFFRDGLFAKRLVKKKIRFVVFFHGWDMDFEKKVSEKYINFFQSSFGKAHKIMVLSYDFKTKLEQWGFKGEIVVETTTVDSKLVEGFSLEEKQGSFNATTNIKILFLSRLLKEKGIYEVIDSFRLLKTKYSNLELIIAGDGKDFNEISAYVAKESDIIMKGYVEGQEKMNLFKSCDIYCLPSYSEGLPTSVLEAMAFGLPIVTTSVGGLKYFFEDTKMGYIVDVKNKNDLASKLASLISNENIRKQMGEHNHLYVEKNLLSNVVAKRLYEHFLDSMGDTLIPESS